MSISDANFVIGSKTVILSRHKACRLARAYSGECRSPGE